MGSERGYGDTLNISASGALVTVPIEVGARGKIRFRIGHEDFALDFVCVREDPKGSGIEFVNTSEKDRWRLNTALSTHKN